MGRKADQETADTLPTDAPVPDGRAGSVELAQMLEAVQHSPLLHALLNWIDGTVLVLNRQRQILLARTDPSNPLDGVPDEELVGQRLGEALGCRFSARGPDGCGTGDACQFCGALHAVLDAGKSDVPIESQCRIDMSRRQGNESVKFRVRGSRTHEGEQGYTVLVLQRLDRLPLPPKTVEDGDVDWPNGVDTYLHVRRLGRGGMGSVFLVKDPQGRAYALKTLRGDSSASSTTLRRFAREMKLTAALDHPNINRAIEVDRTGAGVLYMISEYVPNGTARLWLQELGPLPPDLVMMWMLDTARALDYAWNEHRIVHRDIKPENLLIDGDNRVKLADFGIARQLESSTQLTLAGSVVGTPQFMAPEQAVTDAKLDVRSDLYALGSSAYFLLTGKFPFSGPDPMTILTRKVNGNPPSIGRFRKDLPTPLISLVDSMIARKPRLRPRDAAGVAELLVHVAAKQGFDLDHGAGQYKLPDN